MAYVTVPKDLTQVKVKVALGLTKRQLICFGAAAAIGVPLFFLMRGNVPTSAAAFIMILVILPCFLFAMYEKHGRPLEAVLKDYYETKFNRPKARPYQTENVYAAAERQTKLYRDVKAVTDGGGKRRGGGGGKRPPGKPPKNKRPLSAAEKRQIAAIIKKAKGDGKPHSAQASIPYLAMYPDGICRVTDKVYSKTVSFSDVSYRLASPDGQTATFENLCDFYNYFDSSIAVQLSFVNLPGNPEAYRKSIDIPARGDDFDEVRGEYAGVLKGVGEQGTNGILRGKYLTFAIENDSPQAAKARLERIETDIHGHFRAIGAKSAGCSGHKRLNTLYDIFHPDGKEPFAFDWNWLAATGMTTKDFIAPTSFTFGDSRYFRIGEKWGAASFLQILAPELNDKVLSDFLEMESSAVVTLHLRSIDQTEAIKSIKRTITTLDSAKINEQKKAVQGGWDMDILPSDLQTFGGEAKNILKDLQTRNERMFMATILVVNIADTKQQLDNEVFAASGIAQQHNCTLHRLDNQQEIALMSSLPMGVNTVPIQRGLTTSAASIFIPFTTGELFQSGEALYYGRNAISGNMIMADRKQLKNPNGLILGTPGSGKSFAAKREITNAFLITNDDVLICDPEAEYHALVEQLHGQVIVISPTGKGPDGKPQYINPMDINLNYSDEDNPVALKSDFILSFCEVVAGGRDGLQPVEKSVIDKAVRDVYRGYLADPDPANMPVLEDLYNALLAQDSPDAKHVAAALEIYVHGSLNVFNHRTNVDINNRLVCFDIKELGKQLKTLGMLVVQDQIWNRVTVNRAKKRATRYYCDEFHLLLKGELGAWSVEIWKRFRKWGGIPTGITQNLKDLLTSVEIENIFENSDFLYLLNHGAGDRDIITQKLHLSPKQAEYITNAEAGEGLIIFGSVILPFVDRFPENTRLYQIMTTRPQEVTDA